MINLCGKYTFWTNTILSPLREAENHRRTPPLNALNTIEKNKNGKLLTKKLKSSKVWIEVKLQKMIIQRFNQRIKREI